jgi:adenine-specific DNA-methyltransferase
MTNKKQKLELTWIGKEKQPRLEPRILIEDPEKSYGNKNAENILIYGDNLLALKALEQDFEGQIKCGFLDPPFNTGSAFTHYNDGLEHSIWLSLMRDRLQIIRKLLSQDGLLFVQIDYREGARLKLLLDEIFGETCFKNEIIVRRGTKNVQSQFDTIDALSTGHDSILLYAKDAETRLPKLQALQSDLEPGKWDTFWRGTDRPTMRYELFGITPERGQWRWSEERAKRAKINYEGYLAEFAESMTLDDYYGLKLQESGIEYNFVRLGPDKTVQYYVSPRNYKILSDVWMDLRTSGKATDFSHEKHEDLLERIIRWTTQQGDLVLDSFGGSGTTGAVAHKMGRRWIMIELGEHCHTHCLPRLKKVVDGTDQGGISKAVNWQGGGGFKYYYLAPSLLKQDKYGNWIIDERYNADMLAAAMAKHEGFKYSPDEYIYWKQGRSTEKDYIFTTTNFITVEFLDKINEEMQPDESLLICCKSFSKACSNRYPNITVRKIPNMLLGRCEFGKEDYSLNIINMPVEENEAEVESVKIITAPSKKKKSKEQHSLFQKEEADEK